MTNNELLETKQIFNENEAYKITADIENEMNQCKEMLDSTLHDYRLFLQGKLEDPFRNIDVETTLFARLEDASCGVQVVKGYIEDIEKSIERKVSRGN
tara:strand:- start:360 stop:653 length:294 start_codon:yes stop_codon:yes gene_type:complete